MSAQAQAKRFLMRLPLDVQIAGDVLACMWAIASEKNTVW
jgi:hypothetical protein